MSFDRESVTVGVGDKPDRDPWYTYARASGPLAAVSFTAGVLDVPEGPPIYTNATALEGSRRPRSPHPSPLTPPAPAPPVPSQLSAQPSPLTLPGSPIQPP